MCNWLLVARVRMQPIIALYFESDNELKFYNLEARSECVAMQSGQSLKWLLTRRQGSSLSLGRRLRL